MYTHNYIRIGIGLFLSSQIALASFVQTKTAKNLALTVGVSHGLSGIDKDVANVEAIIKNPAYSFESISLMNSMGTKKNVLANIQQLSSEVDPQGTLLFYFSGHGGHGVISMQDNLLNIKDLRAAIEAGREGAGPLQRLVMMFDSCYSGSLLDLLRQSGMVMDFNIDKSSQAFMNDVMEAMTPSRDGEYWKELFAFASSRADETSMAGSNGSAFTVALTKAFNESIDKNATNGEFVAATQKYTKPHHPVARLDPQDLTNEKLNP